jgi:hypothetical protein
VTIAQRALCPGNLPECANGRLSQNRPLLELSPETRSRIFFEMGLDSPIADLPVGRVRKKFRRTGEKRETRLSVEMYWQPKEFSAVSP